MNELIQAFGIDWKLILVQTVNFLIVLAGLTYFLYRPLLAMIEKRERAVQQGIEDSEAARRAREAIESERAARVAEANREGEAIVARATEAAKRERADILRQAQERAELMVTDAGREGEALKKKALHESERMIAETAILAAEKIIKERV